MLSDLDILISLEREFHAHFRSVLEFTVSVILMAISVVPLLVAICNCFAISYKQVQQGM